MIKITYASAILLCAIALNVQAQIPIEIPNPDPVWPYQNVCYGDLGCFDCGVGSKYFRQHKNVPQPPATINPTFMLFNPGATSVSSYSIINYDSPINGTRITGTHLFFVTHGFTESVAASPWMWLMAKELMSKGYSVVLLNWAFGADNPDYYQSAANTRVVGAMLAHVINDLISANQISLSSTTLIGFSLGAQIVGFAGKRLPGLFRIYGLDPAGPLFGNYPGPVDPVARLAPTDAQNAVAIHTNGGDFALGNLGTLESLTQVDYYPSGGEHQPGCLTVPGGTVLALTNDLNLIMQGIVSGTSGTDMLCSHLRCPYLFIDILRKGSCTVPIYKCQSIEDYRTKNCIIVSHPIPSLNLGFSEALINGLYFFNTSALEYTPETPDGHCTQSPLA